eukprot:TRINITY_DN47109_c0_g1_i1.p1 TRINITY_DN47109_c0_g1~~TRINITY_DN47109_c0_g1_i1.p1  ORF type:complete len:244 (-),score=59.73 TRINITY_DN47109_c0_g1_i1:31-762(-)
MLSPVEGFVSVVGFLCHLSAPFVIYFQGHATRLIIYPLVIACIVIDVQLVGHFAQNIKAFAKHGYSTTLVYGSMVVSFISIWETFYAYCCIVCKWVDANATPYFDLMLVVKVLLMFAASEAIFTCFHILLHTAWAQVHVLHHIIFDSSYSSTYTFHPVDLLCSLSPILISGSLIGLLYFRDVFAVLVHLSFTATWYAMDHDPIWKGPHWRHHKNLSSNYFAYLPSSGKNMVQNDKLVKLIQKD